ncbi:MAG TPA: type IV toxin-antitoxin system AbiEi family antitoxin [Acidobacteriota bacterium]|nr:type IV toxin-antitoxin system AbiEi family antitoxin [Acidobacteriota bacterium]
MKETEIQAQAKEAVKACLSDVPFLKIVSIDSYLNSTTSNLADRRDYKLQPDLVIAVSLPGSVKLIIAEIKLNGQPLQAIRASEQLHSNLQAIPHSYGIFIAPYISEKAGAICTRNNIGYLDLSGNCRIQFDNVYINKSNYANKFKQNRMPKSLFHPKAERVLRVLLSNKLQHWKLEGLSKEARVSIGHASKVGRVLIENAYAMKSKKGIIIIEPDNLLADWSDNYEFARSSFSRYYTLDDLPDAELKINDITSKSDMQFAFTGFSGANLFAPATIYNRAHVYIDKADSQLIAMSLNLKEVDKGHNIVMIDPYDDGVYYKADRIDHLKTVGPVQLYLDLMSMKGRGEDAAKFLLESVITKSR